MIFKVGPFCRKGLSPQGEPLWVAHPFRVAAWPSFRPRSVTGRCDVLLGMQDLQKSVYASLYDYESMVTSHGSRFL